MAALSLSRILFRLLGVAVLVGALAGGWLWQELQLDLQRPLRLPEAGYTLVIEPGTSLRGVMEGLAQRGFIDDTRLILLWARWKELGRQIRAGEYRLQSGLTVPGLLELLTAGRVVQHSLTLVEGWTFREVRHALEQSRPLRQTLQGLDDEAVMAAIGHAGEHPEGRFFPDTYYFPAGTTDRDFLLRAYRTMERVLRQEWEERAEGLPYETPYQALIMASIIEKETGLAGERARIAGVFVRRLQRGMLLQTDPTVIYGLGEAFDGNLRRRDLRRDGPYNTYRRKGLPPTPICMPGRAALHAALHPAPGDALYFVARGDGSHVFSADLESHRKAVARYQLGRRGRK